jgi:N-acetylmuramoyl-L-alanine amidase
MKVVISAGHGKKIRGAAGSPIPPCCDEVDEARKVTAQVGNELDAMGVNVITYWDDVSTTQSENLTRIVDFHNAQGAHDWDFSVHFNAYDGSAHGCEVLYVSDTGHEMAKKIVDAICTASGLTNRGAKYRSDLKFLNATNEPACLLEIAFCDNPSDCNVYRNRFGNICAAIAETIAGEEVQPGPEPEPPSDVLFSASGTCSTFGGPADSGVSPSEGLAFIYSYAEAPWLFLRNQPPGTSGLARRLEIAVFYLACRWDYDVTSKIMLRDSGQMALVTAKQTGIARLAHPADWGPHEEQTGRVADLSPALADSLGVSTDDQVEVIYPFIPSAQS